MKNYLAPLASSSFPRRIVRATLAALTLALVALGGFLSPASAETPVSWQKVEDVSWLRGLEVLVLFPLGVAAVITILALLPDLARKKSTDS